MRFYPCLVVSLFVTLGLSACADEGELPDDPLASATSGVIIGSNDLVSVAADGANVPARYRPLLEGFGRLLIPGSTPGSYALCTATHLGGGLVVTAGHCFSAPANRVDNVACSGVQVQWGYRTGKNPTLTSSCTTILAMETNNSRDYAFFKVNTAPSVALAFDTSSPSAGTGLTIFSHPGGRPLEWSKTCSLISQPADHFGYQCDTQGGSSGAAVLRDDTLAVVGIHWGGGGDQNSATYLGKTATDKLGGGGGAGPIKLSMNSGFCVDVSGGSTANVAGVLIWPCHGGPNQQWQYTAGQLRVYGNKCLDVREGVDANGTALQIWDCTTGNGNQQWLREGDHWRWAGHDKCVDLKEGKVANLNPVHLWTCDANNNNQRWL
jgi:hypothetical protein